MDPFSTAVNVVTILNVACKSSMLLYNVFCGIRGAPAEINHYCAILEGLNHTFSALNTLCSTKDLEITLSDGFPSQLASCLTDLKFVRTKLQKSGTRLRESAVRRSWERVKWSISSEVWLEKFFARLQMYHINFDMELSLAQL